MPTLRQDRRREAEAGSEPPAADRSRLLELLRRDGILYASESQPVLSRDGTTARWMLDSLGVSLRPEGIALAGRCLAALVRRFEGRQVATYGVTAIPLLTACVRELGGAYRGLVVRKERKAHGSRKLIEGVVDPDEPVVVLDDSVSSGTTMEAARHCLEEAGLRVEGGVCLVRFGWYGGFALMQEHGYQMEAVYDIWEDFIYHMEGEADPLPNPTKVFPELRWLAETAPEGLHPAHLARHAIERYLETGAVPRAPRRLDRDYDARGGTWVSVRPRTDVYQRHARDGFWHFPEEGEPGPPGRDLVLAALKTAAQLPAGEEGLRALAGSAIAVTFFSPLEECTVGELDDGRYGIVVRSRERPGRMGGALPRMPGIAGAWAQFQHARRKNAELASFEPYQLLRHEVVKVVEPGASWQPTGVPRPAERPWLEDAARAGRLATRARELALEALGLAAAESAPLTAEADHRELDSVFVTTYLRGQLRGCTGKAVEDLDADLRRLVGLALDDGRFEAPEEEVLAEHVAVTVSLLHHRLDLGAFSPEEVMARVRLGEQALQVSQGGRSGLLLPFVAAHLDLDPLGFALEVIDKAGVTRPPYHWRRYECVTWVADDEPAPRRLRGALPLEPPPPTLGGRLEKLAGLLGRYLLRHRRDDGRLYFRYRPHQDVLYEGGDLPRIAHGAWVLCRAGRRLNAEEMGTELGDAGRRLLGWLRGQLEGDAEGRPWLADGRGTPSVAELSFLLLALCELTEGGAPADETAGEPVNGADERLARRLAEALWERIGRHGRIETHRETVENAEPFQDYFPGQVLLALARACGRGFCEPRPAPLARAFSFYRHRFRHRRHFGQVSWQMQAFTAWALLAGHAEHAAFVFEIADWLLGFQQVETGGFLNDHQRDTPGYTTALYVEGLGAAVRLAEATGEGARAERYRDAYHRGLGFVDGLVIQEHQAPLLPNPAWALGGVRSSLGSDEVRIDFVQHALSAVLELHPPAAAGEAGSGGH